MSEIVICDRASDFVGQSTREYTKQGFLKIKGRVARSGVQSYYGFELGMKDNAFKRVNLYRPPEVVLNDEVCAMFDGVDVTNDHPKEWVDSKNYRKLTSGFVHGKAYKDEENPNFILCDMVVKDEDTIKALEAGKIQLSVGYKNTIEPVSGTTPEGEHYDAIVRKITAVNHVALVSRARAGFDARVFDSEVKMKTLKLGDSEFELANEMADAISKHVQDLKSRAEEAQKTIALKDGELGEKSAEIESLKAELEKAKSMILSDEDIKEVIKNADDLRQKARKIAGEKFMCDSVDPLEIMKSALTESGCEVDMNDKSEDFIKGFFEHALAQSEREQKMNDSQTKVAKALEGDDCKKPEKSAYQKMMEKTSNAWKQAK